MLCDLSAHSQEAFSIPKGAYTNSFHYLCNKVNQLTHIMNHLYRNLLLLCILSLGLLNSCREDAPVVPAE